MLFIVDGSTHLADCNMASKDLSDQLKDLTLESIILQNKELGYGAYGKVFTVDYLGLSCAAKGIHSLLLHGVSAEDKKAIKDGFIRECYHSSLIRHPNIVQFMGVYYTERSEGSVTKPSDRRNLKFEFKFPKFQVNFSKFQISP